MTNRSIALLAQISLAQKKEKEELVRQIIEIEYKKILAQAKNFIKMCDTEKLVNDIFECKDSNEIFEYLRDLSVVQISLLSSYGIDVAFMNLLKVSD